MSPSAFRPSRHATRPIRVSFEFFPPKTEEMEKTLWSSIERLAPLGPSFVSVTYGAGGSTRERTHRTVQRILGETALKPAAHLTCVAATREEVDDVVRGYRETGVRHIVALRGDPVAGIGTAYEAHPGGYAQTSDLVAGIKRISSDFEVSVSAYPEKHPEAPSLEADLDALKMKVDAGADRAITQFFFDNDIYLRYLDKVHARGIDVPIVPGILPVQNFKLAKSFAERAGASVPEWLGARFDVLLQPLEAGAERAGASVPEWLGARFEGLEEDVETRKLIAAAVAAEQVLDLVDRGVRDFHFYTMNRADLVYAICHLLGLRARSGEGVQKAAA